MSPAQTAAGQLPGGPLDPLNYPGDVAGAASSAVSGAVSSGASAVWSSVEPFLARAIFVLFGLALMGLGAYKVVSPGRGLPSGGLPFLSGGSMAPGDAEAPAAA